ncbi:MAG TPA: hypothetical protein VLE20_14270, partial [Blastocatellia bacterium]|nr:hypothetical protein [Blastocatellia bacterium]
MLNVENRFGAADQTSRWVGFLLLSGCQSGRRRRARAGRLTAVNQAPQSPLKVSAGLLGLPATTHQAAVTFHL